MRYPLPTVPTLLKILESTSIHVVERAYVEDEDGKRRTVRGWYDHEKRHMTLGKTHTRSWGRADDLIQVAIHELLHAAVPQASEAWVKRKDMSYFKIPELREAVAVRLLDIVVFGR